MGQVSRFKSLKALKVSRVEPAYRQRQRDLAVRAAERQLMASVEQFSAARLVSAYVDLQRRAQAHNVRVGVYAPHRSAAIH